MAIYLSQHGKSASKDIDPKRGLTEEGVAEVKYVASLLQQGRVQVDGIHHSGKERALQTAMLFAKVLKLGDVSSCDGINPMDDVTAFAKTLDTTMNQLYVGHLPFMQRLASYLITGDPKRPVIEFQNGGVVCLDNVSENNLWVIRWTLVPSFE